MLQDKYIFLWAGTEDEQRETTAGCLLADGSCSCTR